MSKIKVDSKYAPFPKPIALIGSMVEGKPNFMNVAWFNRACMDPNLWTVSLNKLHHTVQGILESKTFSINLPDRSLVEKLDYCGLVSGRDVDKSELFEIFYGDLKTAPMITECPVCFELSVKETIEIETQVLFIGKVENIFTEEQYLTDTEMDPSKFDPLFFIKSSPEGHYYTLGDRIAKAWSIGSSLKGN